MGQKLYEHSRHSHQPQNVNQQHQAEQEAGGFNTRLAVLLVRRVGSMPTAYGFVGLALIGLLAILGIIPPLIALLVAWMSQTLIQLCLLPIIMVGQNVLGRKAELLADETFENTQRALHDSEQLVAHLSAQDDLALKDSERLQQIDTRLEQQQEVLYLLLEHLEIEAKLNTDHRLPIVKVGGHTTHINEDDLRISLARAGIKPEILGALPLETLLLLERQRPHSQEVRHAAVREL